MLPFIRAQYTNYIPFSLYNVGYNPTVQNLFPKIEYPVSRGTPMISPLIKWEHSVDWYVPYYIPLENVMYGERILEISVQKEVWSFITGHVVDGKSLENKNVNGYIIKSLVLILFRFLNYTNCRKLKIKLNVQTHHHFEFYTFQFFFNWLKCVIR